MSLGSGGRSQLKTVGLEDTCVQGVVGDTSVNEMTRGGTQRRVEAEAELGEPQGSVGMWSRETPRKQEEGRAEGEVLPAGGTAFHKGAGPAVVTALETFMGGWRAPMFPGGRSKTVWGLWPEQVQEVVGSGSRLPQVEFGMERIKLEAENVDSSSKSVAAQGQGDRN